MPSFFFYIELYFNSYLLSFLSGLNIINNIAVMLLFMLNRKIRRSIPKTVHLNYIAMAFNDINNSIAMQVSHFLGTLI